MGEGIDFEAYLAEVEAFTREELIPNEERVEELGHVPEDLVRRICEMRLFAISIPEEYGGLGLTQEQQVRLTFAFTQASAVFRARFSTTIGLCSQAILDFATEAQKRKYLPAMAEGRCTGAFSLTEPDYGSDAANLATTAVRDGADYVLNGTKRYITNAADADMFLVMARTGGPGAGGVSAFAVDAGTPGIRAGAPVAMMGHSGSRVSEVYLEDCRVPGDALVGGREGLGLKAALRGINHARTHVAATCVGQAKRLVGEAVRYARGRRQFGKAIGEHQLVQAMLADMRADTYAAEAMVLDCARRFERRPLPFADIACAKYFASEMVSRVADKAVQILGGQGYMAENAVARLYRDTRLFRIFEGTSQIQQQQIARAMLRDEADA